MAELLVLQDCSRYHIQQHTREVGVAGRFFRYDLTIHRFLYSLWLIKAVTESLHVSPISCLAILLETLTVLKMHCMGIEWLTWILVSIVIILSNTKHFIGKTSKKRLDSSEIVPMRLKGVL